MGKKAKGSSRPPATDRLMCFYEDNRLASRYINWRVAELGRANISWRGISFSSLLTMLYQDPAVIRRWKAAETEDDKAYLEVFRKLCRLVAQSIAASHPGIRINVTVNKKDEPLQKEGKPHHRHRRITAEDSKRRRYEMLLEIERMEGCSRTAAVGILADRRGIGESTIWEAVQFVEKDSA